jgi:DNA repair photolyase
MKIKDLIFTFKNAKLSISFIIIGFFIYSIFSIFNVFTIKINSLISALGIGLITAGLTTVIYNLFMYRSIINYLDEFKSILLQGISIFPDHINKEFKDKYDHSKVLAEAKKSIKVLSTTGYSYFDEYIEIIEEKIKANCDIRILLMDPESDTLRDRCRHDNDIFESMKNKIENSIRVFKSLKKAGHQNIKLRFYDYSSVYQSLIIDDKKMFISPRIYSIPKTKNTPCIVVNGNFPDNYIFNKYLEAFDFLWNKNSYIPSQLFNNKPIPKPILYFESYLTLNVSVGCNNNCKYCFLKILEWGNEICKISTPFKIVNLLLKNPYFIPDETILCIGSRTEPFSEENIDDTIELLGRLNEEKLKNCLLLITKGIDIKEAVIERIKSINKNLKLVFCISYSDLPGSEEPNKIENIESVFKLIKSNGYEIIHYWRPIVSEYIDEIKIKNILNIVSKYCNSSVCVGLKIPTNALGYFRNVGYNLSANHEVNDGHIHYFPIELKTKILNIGKRFYPKYPIYIELTSCAISNLLQKPDYLANNIHKCYKKKCELSQCMDDQKERCKQIEIPTDEKIKICLAIINKSGMNYRIENNSIFFEGNISKDALLFIYHKLNYPVYAQEIAENEDSIFNNTYSEIRE